MEAEKNTALICVTRNNAEKLRKTLNSIILHTDSEKYDLFLIDNASNDDTLGIYQQYIPADNITIVRSGRNLHWVGGINMGIEMTKNYRYVGFLNDDIEVCPNWLENLFHVLDYNADTAAVGPFTSNSRDWQGYDNVRSQFPNWDLPELKEIDRYDVSGMHTHVKANTTPLKIKGMLAFFCVLMRRSVIDSIGLLDSDFTEIYLGDDDDYCDRIQRIGYNLALSPNTYVAHYSGNSSLHLEDYQKRQRICDDLLSRKYQNRDARCSVVPRP
jgi:GT2 family glycosyltransferase